MTTFKDPFAELPEKIQTRPEGSGTIEKLDKGVHFIGKRIIEEVGEVWMAAEYESLDDCALEISQLFYHAQMMMIAKGLSLEDVYQHLRSGLHRRLRLIRTSRHLRMVGASPEMALPSQLSVISLVNAPQAH